MRRLALLLTVVCAVPVRAQTTDAVASWIHLRAVPGAESATARALSASLTGWSADEWGNLTRTVGSGTPRRVVACALDYSAFVVSQITDAGYLRVRRTGTPSHPLWNQFQEAQRIAVLTARGSVPGVVAVPNGHFARQHVGDSLAVTDNQLWIDIGASSRAEAEALGVAMLDPVMPDRPLWTFGAFATGPAAGQRAGCAAVASAASQAPAGGSTTFVLSTQRTMGWLGLATVLSKLGPVDAVALVDAGRSARSEARLSRTRAPQAYRSLVGRLRVDSFSVYAPAVRWAGATVESIDSTEALAMRAWVAGVAGVAAPTAWVAVKTDTALTLPARRDGYALHESLFRALADVPGVSGHEAPVRAVVLAQLPAWARTAATIDSAGNVVVAAGPDRDPIAMIAHMDEVGFEVDRILPDGRVTLKSLGGVGLPSWESVPAYLHFDAAGRAPLRGVFVPRDSSRLRGVRDLTAWFGMDSSALVAAGVRPGLSLTAFKRADRLAGTRFTGRSSDDRTGSAALLAAVRAINPATLPRRVYFVWAVQEEVGLNGARAFGEQHGATLKRVYAIDTFVSSDTPLESPHMAYAPLGRGAVLRGVDGSTVTPRALREQVQRVARLSKIPLQVGTTEGGTDGSAVSPWGAPNVGLSWPGRYSHGPAEVLDLRDVDALSRLIVAIATDK